MGSGSLGAEEQEEQDLEELKRDSAEVQRTIRFE